MKRGTAGGKSKATIKTVKTKASVSEFLGRVTDEERRKDCKTLVAMMKAATGAKPAMWGSSIVGFGSYHYVGASGREGDWMLVGFSPRKQNLTVYIMAGVARFQPLVKKLGKIKTGSSCLYLNRLSDVDLTVLRQLVTDSVKYMKKAHPA